MSLNLGTAATGTSQTVTLVGLALSGVPIVLARRWMRRLEQRAEAAYPGPPLESITAAGRARRPSCSR